MIHLRKNTWCALRGWLVAAGMMAGLAGEIRAADYYGMPVLETVNGYKVVDVRPILGRMGYQQGHAQWTWRNVKSTRRLIGMNKVSGYPRWAYDTKNKCMQFKWYTQPVDPKAHITGALYYENGRWIAVNAGASTRGDHNCLMDFGDGMFNSGGTRVNPPWCFPWPKTLPTVTVCFPITGDTISVGVVVNEKETGPAPVYPSAPSNTYRLIESRLNWSQARDDAVKRGGYLATITSPAEWANVLKQVGSAMLNKEVWIGATDQGQEGNWRWVTGEPWNYSRWTGGQPNNAYNLQHYAHLWSVTGDAYGWDDVENVALSHYLLEINGSAVTPPTPTWPAAPSNTYRLIESRLNWTQARDDAVKRGGYLASITSPAEWSNVLKQVGSAMLNKEVWIGATDEGQEGTWRWLTGEAWNYSRWTSGQPNNSGGRQHYTHLWSITGNAYGWDDMENVAISHYLLEINGASPPPDPEPAVNTYRLIQASLNWHGARDDAVKQGGYLATITSAAEWAEMVKQVGAANLNGKEVWLGATDEAADATWRWVTGEAWSYSRWASGQPNNYKKRQHYLHLWGYTGSLLQWDDMENVAVPYYLLEIPAAQKALAKAASVSAPRPVEIMSSGGEDPNENVWNAMDGNAETAWMGQAGAKGWWMVLSFAKPVAVAGVKLDWGEDSPTGLSALWSTDASTWKDLSETAGPASLTYLWLVFPDDGSGRAPVIREIEIE